MFPTSSRPSENPGIGTPTTKLMSSVLFHGFRQLLRTMRLPRWLLRHSSELISASYAAAPSGLVNASSLMSFGM